MAAAAAWWQEHAAFSPLHTSGNQRCWHSAAFLLLPFIQSGPAASEIAPPTFVADLAPLVTLSENTHLTYTPKGVLPWCPKVFQNPTKLTTKIKPHTIL